MRLHTAVLGLLLAAGASLDAARADSPESDGRDPRLGHQTAAPDWLRAVGKLVVPGERIEQGRQRHYTEDCSATLVAAPSSEQASLLVSAWHCLEHYRDLSRDIVFTTPVGTGLVERRARPLASGGSMDSDWALLRLDRPIARHQVTPLALAGGEPEPRRSLLMAGYSKDAGTGNLGRTLSYDPACRLTHYQGQLAYSDCTAFKGASGGAVVQLTGARTPQLTGVISAGDSAGVSVFLPVARFRATLQRHLAIQGTAAGAPH